MSNLTPAHSGIYSGLLIFASALHLFDTVDVGNMIFLDYKLGLLNYKFRYLEEQRFAQELPCRRC